MKHILHTLKTIKSSTIPKESEVTSPDDGDKHYLDIWNKKYEPPYDAEEIKETMAYLSN